MSASRGNNTGIDFVQALEILSIRAAGSHSREGSENHQHHGDSCPCRQPLIPQAVKQLGQVIDISSEDSSIEASAISTDEGLKKQRQELEAVRVQRRQELHDELHAMSVPELVRAVIAAQQQRVITYKSYDRGLETVLHTRNLTLYPTMIADATASFAVISDTINAIKVQFERRGRRHCRSDLKGMITRLQTAEQQKLNLTAALHLEQIRLQSVTTDNSVDNDDDAARTRTLLQGGVQSLRAKVADCVESINEIMEELQCTMIEEDEIED